VESCKLDVHESVHLDTIMKITHKMQLYSLIYYSKLPLHVSGDVFAHHQEHLTVFTVSVTIHPSSCRHQLCEILLQPLSGYSGYANAPRCYVYTYITRLVLNEFV